jgi:Zn-dependent peptidase ImmA (M78 family)
MAKRALSNGQKPAESLDVAYITPAVLNWAINRSRTSVEAVAKRLKVQPEAIEAWCKEDGPHPPFDKAQLFAKLLHVPFGFLFLSQPPTDDLPLPDFRGFDHRYVPSADLRELLNDILVKKDWYHEYEEQRRATPRKFVGSFGPDSDVAAVAKDIRQRLGINNDLRDSASTWSDYLSILSRRAENIGILVMRSGVVGNLSHRALEPKEVLGFAIADVLAPVVFVNSADYKTSQIFTLAHELAHVWIGRSAIANPDELGEHDPNTIEEFCNRVAAEVLVPAKDFLREWKAAKGTGDMRVHKLSRRFWVSGFVTLRRAHEVGELDDDEYLAIKNREVARRKKDKGSGGDYYRNVSVRMSPTFTDTVLSEVNAGRIELKDAAGLLGMKVPTLVRFVEKWK